MLLAMDQGFLTGAVLPPQCAMEDFGGGGGGGGCIREVWWWPALHCKFSGVKTRQITSNV